MILEVHGLVKIYPGVRAGDGVRAADGVRAVDGISLAIAEGTCFGLLGPNGAGKTTTVEMIEGVTEPTSGVILFRGKPRDQSFRERAGIQFQKTALPDFLRVRDVLALFAALYRDPMPIAEVVRLCSLEELLARNATKISGGQLQRLLIALALINDPEILFLDEPTTGLDPQARHGFWDLVRTVRARGKTVVLTTHNMEEAHELCDEVAILDHGKVIARGEPRHLLREQFEGAIVELPADDFRPEDGFPWPWYESNGSIEIQTGDVNATLERLLADGVPLQRLQVKSRTLEDLFLALTGRHLRT